MNQVKTKFHLHQSISSIENLSNELFYEIFDYLDGCIIYLAFSNLNSYFQNLLNSPLLLFKITDYYTDNEILTKNCQQIITHHKQQFYYFALCESVNFTIDSSLNHLQSLGIHMVNSDILISILEKLISLPNLQSLTIQMFDTSMDTIKTYQLAFNLPGLKYLKFSMTDAELPVFLPFATNKQLTSIEILRLDHCCTLEELSKIISYTPKLHSLKFSHNFNDILTKKTLPTIILTNLTYLSIFIYDIKFEKFEKFIQNIHSKIKNLYIISQSRDINFLNAHRWEKLISKFLIQLEKFSLKYSEYFNNNSILPIYTEELNAFNSSFWIERKWLLNIEIDDEHIQYSIGSYKKRWYEYSSTELIKSNRLVIMDRSEEIIPYIKRILTITQIYHLEIPMEIRNNVLNQILNILPDLDSLKIHSILFNELNPFDYRQHQMMFTGFKTSQIKKIYLEKIHFIDEVFYYMSFYRSIVYLKINYEYKICIEYFLRNILQRINERFYQQLRLLCFCVPTADDQLIINLKNMIDYEQLLTNYTIKRIVDHVYIEWK